VSTVTSVKITEGICAL